MSKRRVVRGQLVHRAIEAVDNGTGHVRTHPRTGVMLSRTYPRGEKGYYKAGDILPESILRQLRRLNRQGVDESLNVLYREDVASDEEVMRAEQEADEASFNPDYSNSNTHTHGPNEVDEDDGEPDPEPEEEESEPEAPSEPAKPPPAAPAKPPAPAAPSPPVAPAKATPAAGGK